MAEVENGSVTPDLCVERRLAIAVVDVKAEHVPMPPDRSGNVTPEDLSVGAPRHVSGERRRRWQTRRLDQLSPAGEAQFSGDRLVGVEGREGCLEHLGVTHRREGGNPRRSRSATVFKPDR